LQLADAGDIEQDGVQVDCKSKVPSQEHLNALHIRFGHNAACARAAKQRCTEKDRYVDNRKQAKCRLQRDAAEAAKSEHLRERAAARVASAKAARHQEYLQSAQEEALMKAKRATNPAVIERHRRGAARRATSERKRRQTLIQEVLSDLTVLQSKRLEEDERKGDELQRRCEELDWADCAPVLKTQPVRKMKGIGTPTAASLPSLPRILPGSRIAEDVPRSHRQSSSHGVPRLPQVLSA